MEKPYTENGIKILLPVQIKLETVEKKLQEELIGFKIRKDGADDGSLYGEVIAINLFAGSQNYDLDLELELLTKTKLFKGKSLKVDIQLKLSFDQQQQTINLNHYKATGENDSWLANKLIDFLLNSFIRRKVLDKSNFLLQPKLKNVKTELNEKLENLLEVKKGVLLYGSFQDLYLKEVYFKQKHLVVLVAANGNLAAEVSELDF
ncbi:DUF4403 family protein [Aequorivita marina]|uniref:DUF4403 family protein n=1 Tax=Aequorivita marina TaxID=3073654 RepID=UPI0028745AB1|nr:DUF4403 family protein [Aequorivita sp. S2608]MDS1297569.1 DUF4403 family protein [Aequorivita sp. S2608]